MYLGQLRSTTTKMFSFHSLQYYRRPEENVDFDLTDLEGNYYSLKNDYNLLTDTHLKVSAAEANCEIVPIFRLVIVKTFTVHQQTESWLR